MVSVASQMPQLRRPAPASRFNKALSVLVPATPRHLGAPLARSQRHEHPSGGAALTGSRTPKARAILLDKGAGRGASLGSLSRLADRQPFLRVAALCGALGVVFFVAGSRMIAGGASTTDALLVIGLGAVLLVIAAFALRRRREAARRRR
jgi:LPXTG-motif cell wall-anchored protein